MPRQDAGGVEPLHGCHVVLGVTGGIAAYKAVELCRRLVEAGAHVAPVLSADATRFVGPVTFSAVASEPARTSLWDGPDPIPHTRLGQRADVVVVAPATAHLIGRYAAGLADDLLTATLLATRAPVVLAPAMHAEMWEHPAVVDNMAVLRQRGVRVVDPAVGLLAGGDEGPGRLADVEEIVAAVVAALARPGRVAAGPAPAGPAPAGPAPAAPAPAGLPPEDQAPAPADMAGVRVLVSAGGTREPIDPVRFVGNRSSGRQGHAVAEVAARRGAAVTLVTTADRPAGLGVEVVRVETAAEMEEAVLGRASACEVVVLAAAVADFRPKAVHSTKLKRAEGPAQLILEPTADIAAAVARARRPGQVLVGFAAETTSDPAELAGRALAKLAGKGLDLVVANDVSAPGAGFDHDTNAVTIFGADGSQVEVAMAAKAAVAGAVLDAAMARLAR